MAHGSKVQRSLMGAGNSGKPISQLILLPRQVTKCSLDAPQLPSTGLQPQEELGVGWSGDTIEKIDGEQGVTTDHYPANFFPLRIGNNPVYPRQHGPHFCLVDSWLAIPVPDGLGCPQLHGRVVNGKPPCSQALCSSSVEPQLPVIASLELRKGLPGRCPVVYDSFLMLDHWHRIFVDRWSDQGSGIIY